MTVLFGGDACPLGLSVQFLEAPEADVVAALPGNKGNVVSTPTGLAFPQALETLLPFQGAWTRMLTAPLEGWTALANNAITGDRSSPGPAVGHKLGVRCVLAANVPRYGPGHAQTALEVLGPSGKPPLMYIRALSSTATDGRWEWHESGTPFDFEETDRYARRSKRERFDRPMLLRYLSELGVPIGDSAYGNATLHQEQVTWTSREVTLEEERISFGL